MGAVIGRRDIMQTAQETFISGTYWTERIGSVAALASIKKMIELDVSAHLIKVGEMVQKGWSELADKHNLKIPVSGIYPLGHFDFESSNPLLYKTVFTKITLEYKFLASTIFYASYAHK